MNTNIAQCSHGIALVEDWCSQCNGAPGSKPMPDNTPVKTSGRGPDTKPRVRRTKAEILAARQAGQATPDLDLDDPINADLKAADNDPYLCRSCGRTVNPPEECLCKVQAADQTSNGIHIIPVQDAQQDKLNTQAIDAEGLALKVAHKVTKQVLDSVYETLEARTKSILEQVDAKVKSVSQDKIVIGIKINDKPIVKLKNEAHPNLPETILFAKIGNATNDKWPLLVGPAGSGKTFLAHQLAESLQLVFEHLCFSSGVSEAYLFGRQTPNGFIEASFSRCYKNGGVFLADELDAADPNLLLAINTALANGHMFNPISGENIPRHADFYFIGGANTAGKGADAQYTGRNRLDGATLSRFARINVDYNPKVEQVLCPDDTLRTKLQNIRTKLKERGSNEILSYREFSFGYSLKNTGYSVDKILDVLTRSWPKGLLKECGE